jgi:hypothetical protein
LIDEELHAVVAARGHGNVGEAVLVDVTDGNGERHDKGGAGDELALEEAAVALVFDPDDAALAIDGGDVVEVAIVVEIGGDDLGDASKTFSNDGLAAGAGKERGGEC